MYRFADTVNCKAQRSIWLAAGFRLEGVSARRRHCTCGRRFAAPSASSQTNEDAGGENKTKSSQSRFAVVGPREAGQEAKRRTTPPVPGGVAESLTLPSYRRRRMERHNNAVVPEGVRTAGICGVKLHEAFAGSPLQVSDKAHPAVSGDRIDRNRAECSGSGSCRQSGRAGWWRRKRNRRLQRPIC